jgi:death on curing protein
MARTGPPLVFLDKNDIVQLNRHLVEIYGGDYFGLDNLINPGSLEWVLEAIQHPFFNLDPYPTIAQKAAILVWIINGEYVFYDGNKRTGMFAAILFLKINGYRLDSTSAQIMEIALRVATRVECGCS